MATKRPEPWTPQQIKQVEDMLTCFNGQEEVCAALDVKKDDLNWLCRQAFGKPFKEVEKRFHTVGKSLLRRAMFNSATEGNARALDTLAREQLGLGPVESRRRTAEKSKPAVEEVDF